MITNTSKLQAKVEALTNVDGKGGINILTNTGEFKSTYDILLEISKVWDKMGDMDQAALLEIIAGKRAGSVVAGILQNGDILENAYKDALGADGSAMRELNTYLDSIQGKVDQFNNATQTMWMNFMNSEVVKFWVDVATAIVKVVDNIGLLNVAVGAFAAKTAFQGDSFFQIFDSNKVENKVQEWVNGFKNVGESAVEAADGVAVVASAQEVQGDVAAGAAAKNEVVSASQTKVGTTAKIASVGVRLLNAALAMVASIAITAIITSIASSIHEASKRMEELTDSALDSAKKTEDAQKSLSGYKEEVVKLRKELDSNTLSESEAYNARERLIQIQNDLIEKFGLEAQGLNLVTGEIERQSAAIDELAKKSADDWMKEHIEAYENAKDVMSEAHDVTKEQLLLFQQTTGSEITGTLAGFSQKDIDEYKNGLQKQIEDAGGKWHPWTTTSIDDYGGGPTTFEQIMVSFDGKTIEELDQILSDIQTYMFDFQNDHPGADLTDEITRIQNVRKYYVDESYKEARELYEKGRQQEAIADYAAQYGDILDAQDQLLSADNDTKRLEAIQEYKEKVEAAINKANENGEAHMADYFADMLDKYNSEEIELQIKLDEDNIKTELEKIVGQSGEKGLSALDDIAIKDMIDRGLNVEGATDVSGQYSTEQIAGLVALQKQADESGISLEKLIDLLVQYKLIAGKPVATVDDTEIASVQTYSALSEKVSGYNDILAQTNDITADNMEVAQEYKDSLSDLGFTTEELSECFDENNDLVVKNSKRLRELVAEKKKAAAADVKLAKSQSRLEYYQLVDELNKILNVKRDLTDAEQEAINSTLQQLKVVEQAIYKYQLLEDSLLGATNAFEDFAQAKEIDALNTYGDSYVEMVQTMYDGIYKTGQVGTEAFWSAVEHLVPISEYSHLTEDADKMQAIISYFNKNIAPTLTLKDDSFSIDFDAVENFVEEGIAAGVFNKDGTTGKFNLVEGMNLEEAARLMKMTTAQAYAFFAELDKYNISGNEHSFLSQLDQSTEGQIMRATTELENLNKQKLALLQDGGYEKHGKEIDAINEKIKTQNAELDQLGEKSAQTWQDYSQTDSAISALNQISDKQTELSSAEAAQFGIEIKEGDKITVENALKQLEEQKANLEKPTVLTAQLAQEHIQSELAQLQEDLGETKFTAIVKAELEQNEDGVWVVKENEKRSEADTKYAQQIAALMNADKDITAFLETGLSTTDTYLSSIDGTLKSILARLGGEPAGGDNTSGGDSNDAGTSGGTNPFGGLSGLLDKHGIGTGGVSTTSIDGTSGNENYIVGNKNVTVAEEPTESTEKAGTKSTGTWNPDIPYTPVNNASNVIFERYLRGLGVLPTEETIFPLPTVQEWDFHNTGWEHKDYTVTPGEAYEDPATTSGGNMEAESVNIETTNVSGDVGALPTTTMDDKKLNTPKQTPLPVERAKETSVEADTVVIAGDAIESDVDNVDKLSDALAYKQAMASGNVTYDPTTGAVLPEFIVPSTRVEPQGDVSTKETLNQIAQQIREGYKEANIDLLDRPKVAWIDMNEADWNTPKGSYSTVDTVTFNASEFGFTDAEGNDYAINVTPILPDGTVVDGGVDGLWQYITDQLDQGKKMEHLDVFLGNYDTIEEAEAAAQRLHELQEEYYGIKEEVESNPIEPSVELNEVEELLSSLGLAGLGLEKAFTNGNIAGFNPIIFTQLLQDSEYAKGQIEALIGKVQEYKLSVMEKNADPLGLNAADVNIDSFMKSLDALGVKYSKVDFTWNPSTWFDGKSEVQIEVADLVSTLKAKGWTNEAIKAYCQQLSESANIEGANIHVNGIENIDAELEAINQLSMNDKVTNVETKGAKEAEQALNDVNAAAGDVTKTVTTEYVTKYQTVGSGDRLTSRTPGSGGRYTAHMVNGTAHAQGTAHKGGSWGAPKTETALTGELGPELRVRGNRWELLGENGAEFNEVRKGDIIFNHKQTEELLTNGYITGRGKAFAEGTIGGAAYSGMLTPLSSDKSLSNTSGNELGGAADKLSGAAGDVSDAADEFREVFDWIEVRLEEINERIGLKSAELENVIGSSKQNAVIDDMIALNQKLYNNLTAGAEKYNAYAAKLLAKVPEEYRKAAQDGSIAIEEFVGEADEKTLQAIQDYREWVQKGADATQQAEETLTEIQNLAKQAIDNIAQEYENKVSIPGIVIEQLEAYNALIETTQGAESAKIYEAMIKENNKQIGILAEQRQKMQSELNAQVEAGNIKKYSQAWYDAVGEIAAVDTEILNLTADTEDYRDTINELHWEHFENLISRFEAISDEAENLIDILSNKDLVDKDTAEWTDEGITSLGLYAQQMEVAEMQAKKYNEEIQYLNNNWKKLGYTEQEYIEKLEELKNGQYDAIKAYEDTKDAIVDLTKERVESIKDGIQKEIESYEKLIDAKKKELDAEKDLFDFQKGVANQQKEIADIERKLAALSADNSASARAKRAQLEAELAEARQELEDTYYDRSVSNQQEALDKELEAFQEEKDMEIEGWDKYLEDTEKVVADGLATIQANTDAVYNILKDMGEEYSLSIAAALTSPWKYGEDAIQSYSEKFKMDMSQTVEELREIATEHKKLIDEIEAHGSKNTQDVNSNVEGYQDATYVQPVQQPEKEENKPAQQQNVTPPKKGSSVKVKVGTTHWGAKSGGKKMADFVPGRTYTVSNVVGTGADAQILLSKKDQNKKSATYGKTVYMGWINLKDLEGYASGTTGVKNSQFAWIDELGEELVIRPSNGRMTFMEKGTGVVPADLTSNLMEWGELDPSIMLERNKPVINAPHITNNNMEINMEISEVVHIDNVSNDTIPNLTKAIEKQMDKYMKNVNNNIRKYAR